MTRTEAEHLLDAYVLLDAQGMLKAREALKTAIIDAMTSTTYYPYTTNPKPCPYPQVTYSTAAGEVGA